MKEPSGGPSLCAATDSWNHLSSIAGSREIQSTRDSFQPRDHRTGIPGHSSGRCGLYQSLGYGFAQVSLCQHCPLGRIDSVQGIRRPLAAGSQEVGAQGHQDQDLGAPRAQVQHLDRWLYFGIFEHIQEGKESSCWRETLLARSFWGESVRFVMVLTNQSALSTILIDVGVGRRIPRRSLQVFLIHVVEPPYFSHEKGGASKEACVSTPVLMIHERTQQRQECLMDSEQDQPMLCNKRPTRTIRHFQR